MAISGTSQSLTAAFSFGLLLQAATGALFIYWKGNGSNMFQDGRRLVLMLFLLFAALWALIDFLNLLIDSTATTACQVGLIFSTTFDQLARVVIEQFLLWSVGKGTKLTAARFILQAILVIRVVAGGVLAGFTRPQFAPTCVARTSLLPASIVVLALDGIIIGVLVIQVLSLGSSRDVRQSRSSRKQEQSRALIVVILGFALWTGTSVTMILGLSTILLILRTTLPAGGLLILVGIVITLQGTLVSPQEDEPITPEARSPFINSSPPSQEILQARNVNIDGSPIVGRGYTKSGLFVVNPSTPRDSPTSAFQGQNKGDGRDFVQTGQIRAQEIENIEQDASQSTSGPGYRASSGVFPSMLATPVARIGPTSQGAFAPQITPPAVRIRTIPESSLSEPAIPQKKSIFSKSKPPSKATIRSLGISNPIMTDVGGSGTTPGVRMQTVDLATAAIAERERREAAAAKSLLIASRPAPQPPSVQEGLRKSVSIKRKEMPRRSKAITASSESIVDSSLLSVAAVNGSSTSASLSPGREDLRRRSPRNLNNGFKDSIDEKDIPRPFLGIKQTAGLPSNPKSQMPPRQTVIAEDQRVMLVKDIVYDNPGMVNTIISEAPGLYAQTRGPKTADTPSAVWQTMNPMSADSMIHRPRPYKRGGPEQEGVFFGGKPSPLNHRRSKSTPSIGNRKSILYNHPGNPQMLPPLPNPPTSASNLARLLPNDTKSMTADQKIQLLFPAPPGASLMHSRRSSVPSLPRVPSMFMSETPAIQSPSGEERRIQRASKRTTLSFGVQTPHKTPLPPDPITDIYPTSANTYGNIADDFDDTWIYRVPSMESNVRISNHGEYRRSSAIMYDTQKSILADATPSYRSSRPGTATTWESLHSPVLPIDIGKAMQLAHIKLVQRERGQTKSDNPRPVAISPPADENNGEVYMTVMLDSEENRRSVLSIPDQNRPPFFLDQNQTLSGRDTRLLGNGAAWHRRIGDELETFSERKTNTRSRKLPLPTPLLLTSSSRQRKVPVLQSEPSPVDSMSSPERAIKEIQEHLKLFEEPNRESVDSTLDRRAVAISIGVGDAYDNLEGRSRLLENLEKEMGQQENQWLRMQSNLSRDSMSPAMAPQSPTPSEDSISWEQSQRLTRPFTRDGSRRAHISSSIPIYSKEEESALTQSANSSRASVWQKRLAEAQIEYMENAPTLLRKKSLNFLSVSKAQLASPTPPDSLDSGTDLETDEEYESDIRSLDSSRTLRHAEKPSLWQHTLLSPKSAGLMWNPPLEASSTCPASPEPPAKHIRPPKRLTNNMLPITSSTLWSRPPSHPNSRAVVGLWGSRLARPRSIRTRSVTQRPPRRSKRVTFLPDIIESPEPLPNKRDTLGIFQFPWGEKSDSAVYRPAFDPALLAGPVLNAQLEARSRQLEPELAEYSSSFFDDYDEDEEDDFDPESDDDFDETTLWEIASLLKSEDVPSKNSLLPRPMEILYDGDDMDTDFESDSDEVPVAQGSLIKFPIMPLMPTSAQQASAPRSSSLWASDSTSTGEAVLSGLPQPEESVWQAYIPSAQDIIRSKPRSSAGALTLDSHDLWTASQATVSESTSRSLWSNKSASEGVPSSQRSPDHLAKLWTPPVKAATDAVVGLFRVTLCRDDYRTSSLPAAAADKVRKVRIMHPPTAQAQLMSSKLWSGKQNVSEHHWISESSIRPTSPSLYSPMSSGRSSPTSDVSSLISGSSKASWTTVGSFVSTAVDSNYTWWESKSKSPKRGFAPASDDSARFPSKLPLRLPTWKGPTPVSESRDLATGDLWEAKESILDSVPTRKPRAQRPKVTPGMWKSALAEAILMGTPSSYTKTSLYDPSVLHPVFFTGTLTSSTAEVHPAAIGYTNSAAAQLVETKPDILESKFPRYDAAILHPVFFTESLVSNAVDVHPTAMGHFTVPAAPQMQIKPDIQRPQATPDMWKLALNEAITKSSISANTKAHSYHPGVLHPVFFTESLFSNSVDIHPAAIGHVITKAPKYEAAVLHPVFFAKSPVSNAVDIHPAGLGYYTTLLPKTTKSPMWNASSRTPEPLIAHLVTMWTKEETFKGEQPALFENVNIQTKRNTIVAKSLKLPNLNSRSFWQPSEKTEAPPRNWLHNKTKSAQTWVAPLSAPLVDVSMTSTMWTSGTRATVLPDIFADAKGYHVRKASTSRTASLESLNSTELFKPTGTSLPQTNWLKISSSEAGTLATSEF